MYSPLLTTFLDSTAPLHTTARRYFRHNNMLPFFTWAYALLAPPPPLAPAHTSLSATPHVPISGAHLSRTASIPSATVSGATSTYSSPFTVPPTADQAPAVLPNIKDRNAKQAQSLCPGYKASDVEYTAHGFTATLHLAGDAVRVRIAEKRKSFH